MKRMLLWVVPLALIGVAFHLLWGSGGRLPESPRPPDIADGGGVRALESELPEGRRASALEVQRKVLETTEAEPPAASDLYRIRIMDKGTGRPVPGASVSYYEQDSNPFSQRGHVDPEALALRNGETVTADGEGIAFVPVERSARIIGRHEEFYGELSLDAVANRNPEEEHELLLERDLSLTVRVVDSTGDPVAGVSVGVAPIREGEVEQARQFGSSSEDGLVVEPHLQFRLQTAPPPPTSYVLRAMIPGLIEGGVEIDPESLPQEPVELRLPETGRVLVRLADAGGNLLPALPSGLVYLSVPSAELPGGVPSNPFGDWRTELIEGGTAIFEQVVAGRSYQARASLGSGGWAEGLLAGPRKQDDEVLFDLRMDTGFHALSGRILDEDGEPLAETRVWARIEAETVSRTENFETDANGSFWVFLKRAEHDTTLTSLAFEIRREGASPLISAPILGGSLVLGTMDVGDVVIAEPERLLVGSGTVFVDGEPSSSWEMGRFWVSEWDPAEEQWVWMRFAEVTHGPEGSFELHTAELVDRYRLEYRALASEPYLNPRPVDFAVGARDVELHLTAAGFLMADVLTEDMPPLDNLWLRLVPQEEQFSELDPYEGPGNTRSLRNILYGQPGDALDGRQLFRWHKLWPGRYLLEVQARGNQGLLLTVPDIRIVTGRNEDPRLRGIDLRHSLREIRVTLTDPVGQPIAGMVFLQDPGSNLQQAYVARSDKPAAILLSDPYADLLVAAKGYRTTVREAVSSDLQVRLQRNPEILVRIAGGLPDLEATRVLEVSVMSELPPDERRYVSDSGGAGYGIDSYLRPRFTTKRFEGDNEVAIQTMGAGAYRISLSVVNTMLRRSHPIPGFEPTRAELTSEDGQVLELRIPPEGLAEALQRVK